MDTTRGLRLGVELVTDDEGSIQRSADTPRMRLPLDGELRVLNPPGHAPDAFDLLAVDPTTGRATPRNWLRWATVGLSPARFPSWDRPVVAPCDATVVRAHDRDPDRRSLRLLLDVVRSFVVAPVRQRTDPTVMAGNHIILDTGHGHLVLAHLRAGSVTVAEGERVFRGDVLGAVGTSGNAVAPHLHLQLRDGPDPTTAAVIPLVVDHHQRQHEDSWEDRYRERLRPGRIRTPTG